MKIRFLIVGILTLVQLGAAQNVVYEEIVQSTTLKGALFGDMQLSDVDGDGDLDLFLGGREDGWTSLDRSTIYLNDGNGVFTDDAGVNLEELDNIEAGFSDLDGDGDQDLIITGQDGLAPITELYLNDGSGGFTASSSNGLPDVETGIVRFGDVDGDGDHDVLMLANVFSSNVFAEMYLNDGSANFTLGAVLDADFLLGGGELVDLDGDGDLDIMCVAQDLDESASFLYKNDGNGVFTPVQSGFGAYADAYFAIGDIDNDGDVDAFVSGVNANGDKVPRIYLNDGTGFFNFFLEDGVFAPLDLGKNAMGDFDGDGDMDICMTGTSPGGLSGDPGIVTIVYEQHSPFSYLPSDTLTGSYFSELAVGDITGDNLADVIVSGTTVGLPTFKTWVYSNETTAKTDVILEPEHIGLYVNPTVGIFSIKGELVEYTIEILDVGENVVQSLTQSSGTIEIDLSTLPVGIHFINIEHDVIAPVSMQKIIKF